MSNLTRIPIHFLKADKYDDFIIWVFNQVIPWSVTRDMISSWSFYTKQPISRIEWTQFENRWIKIRARQRL